MYVFILLPAMVALSATLALPPNPPLLAIPPPSSTSPLIQDMSPWPPAPFHFVLSTSLPLSMTIDTYAAKGPTTRRATELLKALANQISSGGGSSDMILNHTETAPGIVAKFTVGGEESGITRLQAMTVLLRLWGFTIVHDAVGISKSEIENASKTVSNFELEYSG